MEAPLKIRLLGPMLVLLGNEPLPRMRSRKASWLLALLATRANQPVSREWVASTLWPDVDRVTAFANLRPVLCELRHALGEYGARIRTFDRNRIILDIEEADVDVAGFDAAIRVMDFQRAVELYRGPFLEGCNEEWVPQERMTRELECLHAFETLGERAMDKGDFERALILFNRAAGLDAWRDAPRRGQMQAFAAKGDVNAALHVYREFAHMLSANAAAQPDASTTELYWHLRSRARSGLNPVTAAKLSVAPGRPPCPLCGDVALTRIPEERLPFERIYCFGPYRFDPARLLLLQDEMPVRVGSRALDLLHLLVQRAGALVGKEELIHYCWPDAFVHENNLMVNIAALRRALQGTASPCILTVPGRGYRFVAPLRVESRSRIESRPSQVEVATLR